MKPSLTRSLLALGLAAAMAACSPTAAGDSSQATTSAEVAGDKAARMDALYATYWEEMLELNPLAATFQGDPRYNDRLPNFILDPTRGVTATQILDHTVPLSAQGQVGPLPQAR